MNEVAAVDDFFFQFSEEKKLELFDLFSKRPGLFLWLQQNLFRKGAAKEAKDLMELESVLAVEKQDIEKQLTGLAHVLDRDQIASLRSTLS